ncbi:hypothetical protein CRYUN_Cryun29cG0087700 [Craigia yunnanensis]
MAVGMVTCLLILLLFAPWISFAQANQGGISDSNYKIVSTGKGLLDGEHVTAATNKNWLGGRKMVVLDWQMKKLKDVKMSGTTITTTVGGTSKFSSPTNSKCGNNLGCEQTISYSSDHEVDGSGFVAFNADYHAPRNHPPKNN